MLVEMPRSKAARDNKRSKTAFPPGSLPPMRSFRRDDVDSTHTEGHALLRR